MRFSEGLAIADPRVGKGVKSIRHSFALIHTHTDTNHKSRLFSFYSSSSSSSKTDQLPSSSSDMGDGTGTGVVRINRVCSFLYTSSRAVFEIYRGLITISGNLPNTHPKNLKWETCGKSHFFLIRCEKRNVAISAALCRCARQAGWCALGVKCAARCSLLTSQTAPHSHADATTRSDMLVRAQMNLNTEMLAACSAAAASRACTERDRR
jgi:hypothetical protein